jgi:hypothetical protein
LRRTQDEMNLGPRPLCYDGFPDADFSPSSFPFRGVKLNKPLALGKARLDYKNGWTVVVFWNAAVYFADEILTFDGMMELIRSRFDALHLRAPVERDYA